MTMKTSTNKSRWRYSRFWRLFRRKKPSYIDITYSYEYMMRFPRLPITVPPLVPTLMSYRWCDEDDCEVLPKKTAARDIHCQQHVRRRLPKRYSDVVGPLSSKIYLPRIDSLPRDHKTSDSLSQNDCQRLSTKGKSSEGFCVINSHSKKCSEIPSALSKTEKNENSIVTRRYCSKNKNLSTTNAVDLLAHRMQAAMSAELMHSLDRNFVFGDKKQSHYANMNRSHSLHITKTSTHNWKEKYQNNKESYNHIIPRVKYRPDDEQKSIETNSSVDELTPDYDDDDEIIIRPIQNNSNNEINEEPPIDYDDAKSLETSETPETDEKLSTLTTNPEIVLTSSFIVQQTSTTPSSETLTHEQSSMPPTPPPLPTSFLQPSKTTFRCRTIAENITADHKLILKDEVETMSKSSESKSPVPQIECEQYSKRSSNSSTSAITKPCSIHLSKEILEKTTLRKVSHPVSRSYSTYGSMSQLNNHDTELTTTIREKSSTFTEPALDGLSSSATTSIILENEYEHRTSSKIYNDYKRRASLITYATNNTLTSTYSHSAIVHPMHTHIGVRSSPSTSSNDKPNENALANKKMNLCVINQLNEHLSTRFRQQQDICLTKNTNSTVPAKPNNQDNYDQPPPEIRTNENHSNVYDEPQNVESTTTPMKYPNIPTGSMPPPPPPPLPVGGFRPLISQFPRPTSSQRTSLLTLPPDRNSTDLRCSTGTSTTSSKLSDARILRELRTNPLFAKAKQHLEIEPDINSRPLNGSTCYLRLDTCSKGSSSTTVQHDNTNDALNNNERNVKMFVMGPNHLKTAENNTAKSMNSNNSKETNRINSRALTNSFFQAQCRQSELEIIFQKRAQRTEQNLT